MGLFDLFKRKKTVDTANGKKIVKPSVPQTTTEEKVVSSGGTETDAFAPMENVPIQHRQYTDEELSAITNDYIDRYGMKGLSKEEAELAKPFAARLFSHFHNNAVAHDHSEFCARKDCDLRHNQPVFLTASRVLCKDCALQYLIGNARDWYYVLGDYASFAGYIPPSIQREGTAIKEKISTMRNQQVGETSNKE